MVLIGNLPNSIPLKSKAVSKVEKDAVKGLKSLKLQAKGYSKKGAQQIATGEKCTSAADKSRVLGMMKKSGSGMASGLPNVCRVPGGGAGPIPVPFPNIGSLGNSAKGALKGVKMSQKAVTASKSGIGKSLGNEAGSLKGMLSKANLPKGLKL